MRNIILTEIEYKRLRTFLRLCLSKDSWLASKVEEHYGCYRLGSHDLNNLKLLVEKVEQTKRMGKFVDLTSSWTEEQRAVQVALDRKVLAERVHAAEADLEEVP